MSVRATIVSRIYRPEPAAASIFLGSVADALIAGGHTVDVITVDPPAGMTVESRGERVRTFPVLRDKTGYVRGYLQYMSFDVPLVFRLLFAKRPDVVFVEPPPTTGVVVRIVCAIRRIPYVYDAADVWSDAARLATDSGAVVRVLRAFERFAMKGAAHLVTISQGVEDRARELGVDGPITVTGFGADTNAFRVTESARERVFVYAGTFSAWHGADVLVDAFAQFSTTHPGYVLRFIGNGTERSALEARADELGVGDAVEFAAFVPPEELAPHLSSAVASLATQRPGTDYQYAFASKAYSALAAGCPVIFAGPGPTAGFIESANEHVRAGAGLPYTAEAVATAMRAFADDPLTSTERAALGAWAADEHSLDAAARRVVDVIESVAATSRSGR